MTFDLDNSCGFEPQTGRVVYVGHGDALAMQSA